MTLMPVSNIWRLGSSVSNRAAGAVDLPARRRLADVVGVERLADHVEDVAEHGVADGHGDAATGVDAPIAPRASPSVGFRQMQRTRPSPICWATSAVMTNARFRRRSSSISSGRVDLGQCVRRELDVDDRACDRRRCGRPRAVVASAGVAWQRWSCDLLLGCSRMSRRSSGMPPAERSASAPPTISMISVVIESWRARFITRRSVVSSSSAFSVAADIARWRAVCSEAEASSSARVDRRPRRTAGRASQQVLDVRLELEVAEASSPAASRSRRRLCAGSGPCPRAAGGRAGRSRARQRQELAGLDELDARGAEPGRDELHEVDLAGEERRHDLGGDLPGVLEGRPVRHARRTAARRAGGGSGSNDCAFCRPS